MTFDEYQHLVERTSGANDGVVARRDFHTRRPSGGKNNMKDFERNTDFFLGFAIVLAVGTVSFVAGCVASAMAFVAYIHLYIL